jgi:twinkle protein
MTAMRSLVEELGCGMILVSHLKRPEGKGHEEGAQTSLAQLRGSAAIGQLSDIVIGLERNQQDPKNKNVTCVRVLKNRFSGETGLATALQYDKDTGRLIESSLPTASEFDDESSDF